MTIEKVITTTYKLELSEDEMTAIKSMFDGKVQAGTANEVEASMSTFLQANQ